MHGHVELGRGPEVRATREQVRDSLFEEWLAEGQRRARVEGFWGAAEAAELPAVSL